MVTQEGVYANGQVVVQPLPEAIFGPLVERTVPLRRIETLLTDEQLQEHCEKELQKVCHQSHASHGILPGSWLEGHGCSSPAGTSWCPWLLLGCSIFARPKCGNAQGHIHCCH